MLTMNARLRRLIYVLSYEGIAIVLATILLWLLGHGSPAKSLPVAAAISLIAVSWNFIFNTGFEWAEQRWGLTRGLATRVAHAIGFEGGLVLFTVPLLMVWYQVGVIEALMMEAVLLAFFLFYTFAFTWVFDQIIRPPHQPAAGG